jgi:2-C-methyl-D-erythritol 2,4-cyclodiphosphate synthase
MSAERRVGIGYDTHRVSGARTLVLGGIEVPGVAGLQGHSDADVLTHAVIDALLGAAALGDIGRHFPDTAPEYENADSIELLGRVVALVGERGWRVVNVDATVICEQPSIAPLADAIAARLAAVLEIESECVSVKGTSNEGIGFIGRGEGIATIAVALLER